MEAYYYSRMDKIQQNVYHAMKSGLMALHTSFSVKRLKDRELMDVFLKLRLDCPEIFYAVGFQYRFYRDSENVRIIPEYLFDKGKIEEHQKAMKARILKLVRPVRSLTEWDKELYIHDFICSHVRYDKLKKPYSHEIIGPLGQGVGVCEGIAKTVKVLCDALGIWCITVISEANPEKRIKYRHAWNIVRIKGNYYQLDVTFDNSLGHGKIIRYDYFNLDDKQIFRDHELLIYEAPRCNDGSHTYYREKKLSFTKTDEVIIRSVQAMRKGIPLVFQWRGGHLTREMCSELHDLLEQTAESKEKHARISLNFPQAVLQVTFTKEAAGEEFIVEAVNEGEA